MKNTTAIATTLGAALLAAATTAAAHPGHGSEGALHLLRDHAGLALIALGAALYAGARLAARRRRTDRREVRK